MNKKQVLKNTIWLACLIAGFAISACSPKKQGVRAQIKTETPVNSAVSTAADQQATATNSLYKIYSISAPEADGSVVTITSQLQTPVGDQLLPVSTQHGNGVFDSQGLFTDSARGLQVLVSARCSDAQCNKYLLLVTVYRNKQPVYQSGGVSYKDDCKFYSIAKTTVSSMYQTMNDFSNSAEGNKAPMGESSCAE